MDNGKHGAVAAVTLALAIVSAVGLAALGPAVENHLALLATPVTSHVLP